MAVAGEVGRIFSDIEVTIDFRVRLAEPYEVTVLNCLGRWDFSRQYRCKKKKVDIPNKITIII